MEKFKQNKKAKLEDIVIKNEHFNIQVHFVGTELTPKEQIIFERNLKNRPHIVILGAGASIATILNGDKNGKKISAMDGFIENLGLSYILQNLELKTTSNNLEDICSELLENEKYSFVKFELDEAIRKELIKFELPDKPTIYDFLLLSLRKKDLVATFNWDPLLLQAYQRSAKITTDLPNLRFLHGNILTGSCNNHKQAGLLGLRCKECGDFFTPSPLLYPIKHKKYNENPYIYESWKTLEYFLKFAYQITIFGYSAPKTDIAAIRIMKKSWGNTKKRIGEEFEFINIDKEENIIQQWRDFIYRNHYRYCNNFFQSTLAKFPRRTTEALFDSTVACRFLKHSNSEFKENMNFEELKIIVDKLVLEEQNLNKDDFITLPHTPA